MARYLAVAAEANEVAKRILDYPGISPEDKPMVAELLARLVNLGIRCSPRGVQHTVRLAAVREAVRGMPVKVGMVEKRDEVSGRSYHALTTQQVVSGQPQKELVESGAEE